jgi:hypothetical protein
MQTSIHAMMIMGTRHVTRHITLQDIGVLGSTCTPPAAGAPFKRKPTGIAQLRIHTPRFAMLCGEILHVAPAWETNQIKQWALPCLS